MTDVTSLIMWSWNPVASTRLPLAPTPLHIIGRSSERFQPCQHGAICAPGGYLRLSSAYHRSRPLQCFAFRFKIDCRIAIRRFDAGVTQPVANCYEINTCTQEVDYRTIETLEFSIDPERKLIPTLDALRRKRNTGAYDDYGLVAQGEADLAGKLAAEIRKVVEDWIRKNHADKMT